MNRDSMFLFMIAASALCFALANGIGLLARRNRTARAIGTITSIRTANPTASSYRNSKWATVSYKVDGKTCQPRRRIQVPINSQIGSNVMVRYDMLDPEKLYCFSGQRIIISLFVAAVCIFIGVCGLV